MTIKIYNVGSDKMKDATQEDIDHMSKMLLRQAIRNRVIKLVSGLNVSDDAIFEKLKQVEQSL